MVTALTFHGSVVFSLIAGTDGGRAGRAAAARDERQERFAQSDIRLSTPIAAASLNEGPERINGKMAAI